MNSQVNQVSNIPNPFQTVGNASAVSIPSADMLRKESQIPMPSFSQPTASSARQQSGNTTKRRNSTSSATGLSSMINRSIQSQTAATTGTSAGGRKRSRTTMLDGYNKADEEELRTRRRSLPSGGNQRRRSSSERPARYSNAGLMQQSEFKTSDLPYNNTTLSNRDPRPLRDRNFQQAIQEEIVHYLLQNKFDIETNHSISIKALKQPTQKGFIVIFKWLYQRLDPGHRFARSVESDIYQILKNLQYPYLESINKSQISAVGGSSWHKFLGMLHWLVRVNTKVDEATEESDHTMRNQPTQEMISINNPVQTLDEQNHIQEKYELMVENLFINYITECYRNFLRVDDDYTVPMERLALGFEKFTHVIEGDIYNLNSQNERSLSKYQYIKQISETFTSSIEKYEALKNDLEKFQNYITSMETKASEWPNKLQKMKDELGDKTNDVSKIEDEIREILQTLENNGLSVEMIETKLKEKASLLDKLDVVTDLCDKLTGAIKTQKYEANGLVHSLANVLKQYDATLDNFLKDVSTSSSINMDDNLKSTLMIQLKKSLLEDINENVQISLGEMLEGRSSSNSKPLDTQTKKMAELSQQFIIRTEKLNTENGKIRDEILELKEEINQKNIQYQKQERELSELKSKIVGQQQRNEGDLVVQQIELGELQSKNQKALQVIERSIKETEDILQEKERDAAIWERSTISEAETLKRKTEELISHTRTFKSNIETSLITTRDEIQDALNSVKNFKTQ